MSENWIDSLFEEKSLWAARKVSRTFPRKRSDVWLSRIMYLAVLPVTALACAFYLEPSQGRSGIIALSYAIFTYSATVIGFLVTGLAIFTSLSNRKVWIALAETAQKGTEVSSFKYIFFNLVSVFVTFLSALTFSVLVYWCANIGRSLNLQNGMGLPSAAAILNGTVVAILLGNVYETLWRLKSFIWNIYTSFLSVLTVSTLIEDD